MDLESFEPAAGAALMKSAETWLREGAAKRQIRIRVLGQREKPASCPSTSSIWLAFVKLLSTSNPRRRVRVIERSMVEIVVEKPYTQRAPVFHHRAIG